MFDVAYIGHYTKDTIIYPHATRLQDGGAFFYGLNAVARMGLKSAAFIGFHLTIVSVPAAV